jgi:hypothetical protein
VFITGVAALAIGIYAEIGFSTDKQNGNKDTVDAAVSKGLKCLVSTQGKDGGWGAGPALFVRVPQKFRRTGGYGSSACQNSSRA